MIGPSTAGVRAEEGSQKGEKATYKSFKYVRSDIPRGLDAVNLYCEYVFRIVVLPYFLNFRDLTRD